MRETPAEFGRRPDIDGLRAIAVLAVILYHYDIAAVVGGFSGVDMFFVISGYVITRKIVQERQAGSFSYPAFFAARVRRIVPALTLMVSTTIMAGYFILAPGDYERLGLQAAFAAVGLSNVYFYQSINYFAGDADLLPLLHTWSLGVEEQYYIIWPWLLLLLLNFHRRALLGALASMIILSLFVAQWQLSAENTSAAFYLLPARMWELALGGCLIFLPRIASFSLTRILRALGVALLTLSFFILDNGSSFPGLNALYACGGVALLIHCYDKFGAVSTILEHKVTQIIGLMSYSLYLWHWPVIALYRHYAMNAPLSSLEKLSLLTTTAVLSFISWRMVEQPFRHQFRPKTGAAVATLSGAITVAIGAIVAQQDGLYQRLSPPAQEIAKNLDYRQDKSRACRFSESDLAISESESINCQTLAGPRVLLMGDSHADHYVEAFARMYPTAILFTATSSGCRPTVGTKGRAACVNLMKVALEEFVPKAGLDVVLLSARWRNGSEHVAETVKYLRKFAPRVIVLGQTIEYTGPVPQYFLGRELWRKNVNNQLELKLRERLRAINRKIGMEAKMAGAEFFDPLDVFCSRSEQCDKSNKRFELYQRDYGHLTPVGALHVLAKFKSAGLRF